MAVTGENQLADRMRQMSLHGLSHDAWKRFAGNTPGIIVSSRPGYKYNLTDIAAAIGIHQLAGRELCGKSGKCSPDLSWNNWPMSNKWNCHPTRQIASMPGTCSRFDCGSTG